jgi:transcriptional antiterminator RfaH
MANPTNQSNEWLVVYTKPKAEHQALEHLERQGYEAYLPRASFKRVRRGQWVTVTEPLFPRYLFVHAGPVHKPVEQRPIGYTTGVSRLVRFGLNCATISSDWIAALRHEEATRLHAPQAPFKTGDRVTITQGPLAYVQGIFDQEDASGRARVLLQVLGGTLPHQVPADALAPG